MIAGSQAIAEVCFHMIADDRRTFCDLRSAIRDHLRSYGNQPLKRKKAQFRFPSMAQKRHELKLPFMAAMANLVGQVNIVIRVYRN